jgi:RNA polymerase sigma factor (sigma-70 family)
MSRCSVHNPFLKDFDRDADYQQELENLVIKLRSNNANAADKKRILVIHSGMICYLVSKLSVRSRSLVDDLLQEAIVAAIEAINRAATELYDNNISPYINSCVCGAINNYIRKQCFRRKKEDLIPNIDVFERANQRIVHSQIYDITDLIDYAISQDDNLNRREYNRVIVKLRRLGYTNNEIAKIIEISTASVQANLTTLRKRYECYERD